jgi:hypothetical protein
MNQIKNKSDHDNLGKNKFSKENKQCNSVYRLLNTQGQNWVKTLP